MPTRLEGNVFNSSIDGPEGGTMYHARLELTMQDQNTLRRSWWQQPDGKWVPSGDSTVKRAK